jgi:3-oxoacyl-(acyl-carrier-protein) synthase
MVSAISNPAKCLPSGEQNQDRSTVYLLAATAGALKDAGLKVGEAALREAPLLVGTSLGGMNSAEGYYENWLKAGGTAGQEGGTAKNVDPCQCTYFGPAITAARRFGLGGGVMVINTGCTSSSHALGIGAEFIRTGRHPLVVVGGTDALCAFVYSGFNCLGILRDDPLDPRSKGLLLGEGAGVMILEDMESVRRRKSCPQVLLAGYGACSGTRSLTESEALEGALDAACRSAFFSSQEVDLINNQSLQQSMSCSRNYSALKAFFGKKIEMMSFFSLKSIIGHTLGASGIFDCITSYLILKKGSCPPGLVGRGRQPGRIRTIVTTESAFGGNHVALLVSNTNDRIREGKGSPRRVVVTGRGALASRCWQGDPLKAWRVLAPSSPVARTTAGEVLAAIKSRWSERSFKLSRMDRFCLLAFLSAYLALKESRLLEDPASRRQVGTVLGTAFGCHLSNASHQKDLILKGPRRVSPLVFPYTLPSAAQAEIGLAFGLRGLAITLTSGWVGGLQSIGLAYNLIRAGPAKRLLGGGIDCLGGVLLQGLEDSQLSKTLPPLSEGAGVVLLETMEEARRRKVPILGEILGFGMDYCPSTRTNDIQEAAQRSARQALKGSGVSLTDLQRIILAPGPKSLSTLVQKGIRSMLPNERGVRRFSSLQDESFAASAPIALCLDGIPLVGQEEISERDNESPLMLVATCPTGSVASLIVTPCGEG